MARGARLRAVTEEDVEKVEKPPARKRPMTLLQALEKGTYLDILIAQRREMVRDVKVANGPAKAAIYRQIALASKEIAQLQVAAKEAEDEDAEADAADEEWSPEAL